MTRQCKHAKDRQPYRSYHEIKYYKCKKCGKHLMTVCDEVEENE